MNTIVVDGDTYTKATALAKQFRYTTDYIGQLCRAGKVECQLVGRSWYVTERSLLAHKDSRYKEIRLNEKTLKNNTKIESSDEEISVVPRLKRVTAKQLGTVRNFENRVMSGVVASRYLPDDTELLPQPFKTVTVSSTKKILPIIPAEMQTVSVVSQSKPQRLSFTELPAVPLHGAVEVSDVEIVDEFEPVSPKAIPVPVMIPKSAQQSRDDVLRAGVTKSSALKQSRVTEVASLQFRPQLVSEHKRSSGWLLISIAIISATVLFGFMTLTEQTYRIKGDQFVATLAFGNNFWNEFWR